MSAFSDSVQSQWYSRPHWLLLLAPVSLLFILITYFRRKYLSLSSTSSSVPIIVVGNIAVGGTGKTPVIIALVRYLYAQGFQPGVITRGYGANLKNSHLVPESAKPTEYGDEPLLIAQLGQCPVVAGPSRIESVEYLIKNTSCDIILSDDGLQHYRLARDIEIAVIDSDRRLGNGWRLPVGPLRESSARLKEVDFTLVNGATFLESWLPSGTDFISIKPKQWRNVKTGQAFVLSDLMFDRPITAIAGIGNPQRFFNTLRALGFDGECRSFSDHHPFSEQDFLDFGDEIVLMTEKDAVKCKSFAKDNWWALSVEADIGNDFYDRFSSAIKECVNR